MSMARHRARRKSILLLGLAARATAQPGGRGGGGGASCTNSSYLSTSWNVAYDSVMGIFTGSLSSVGCPSIVTNFPASETAISTTFPKTGYTSLPMGAPLGGVAGYTLSGSNIYNPLEAGFSSTQGPTVCSTPGYFCAGGADLETCLGELTYMCYKKINSLTQVTFASTGTVFGDDCAGHASPYHYHVETKCEYSPNSFAAASSVTTHSPLIGVALTGQGIYGAWESDGTLPTLDACNGHVGPTPGTTSSAANKVFLTYSGSTVYHYHLSQNFPYTIGCFGSASAAPIGLATCKGFYPNSCNTYVPYYAANGSMYFYDDWCPCGSGANDGAKLAFKDTASLPSGAVCYPTSAGYTGAGTPGSKPTTTCSDSLIELSASASPPPSPPPPSPSSSSNQLSIGTGSTLRASANLTINSQSVSCILSDGITNVTSTCIQVTSLALPDHAAGPWCSGGFWSKSADGVTAQVNLGGIAVDCTCQRNSCNGTCNDICLECPVVQQSIQYLIPLNPTLGSAQLAATGDNNHGQGVALNGILLAPADPYSFLNGGNQIAPLDQYGAHATLQNVYHYHGIPTSFFNCSQGWDSTRFSWASVAPDGQHSPLIGWMLDGLPQFGPFSTGGTVPTDLNTCRSHSHAPYGVHYHAGFHHDTTNSFLNCFTYPRAIQVWDLQSQGPGMGGSGGPGGGRRLQATCPATTIEANHTTFEKYAANISAPPAFSPGTCGTADVASSSPSPPPPPSPPSIITASMTLNGITPAQFYTYQTQWKASLAVVLGVQQSAITVLSANAANGRHLLQTTTTIEYTVSTSSPMSTQSALSNLAATNFLSSFNNATGLTATLGASSVSAASPSSSPSSMNLGLILGVSLGGAAFIGCAVGLYYDIQRLHRNPIYVNVS